MTNSITPTITGISPAEGSLMGNIRITITGSGFTGTTAVNFGKAGATDIEVISDSMIRVTNPNTATSGPVDVEVIVNDKKSVKTPADEFNYKIPEVSGLNPSAGSLAGNEKITIYGQYLTGAQAVNFGKAGASDIIVVSDNEITVTNPNAPAQEVVDVSVIVQGKSSSACVADQFTYTNSLAPGVPIVFEANSLTNTFIQFIGDSSLVGNYCDTNGKLQLMEANKAYTLSSITSEKSIFPHLPDAVPAVMVKSFSGRVYINFGCHGLEGMSDSYTPNAGDSSDINYLARYQYFEPTIKNSQLNVDLSYIDFTSISLSLEALHAPHSTNSCQVSESSLCLATAAGNAALTINDSVLPEAKDQLPGKSFARVISPQLAETSLYHDFTHYLQTTLSNATVRIAGTYVGTGTQPSGNALTQAQSYDYTAVFDTEGNVTLTPNKGSGDGNAAGVPHVQRGTGVGTETGNIVISFDDLNAKTGIYGCNAPYKLGSNSKTKGITNDVYGQVVGDLLAGLNFGYVGSKTQFHDVAIGTLCSTQWWGGTMPDGAVVTSASTPGGQGIYFSGVQDNPLDYNSYAGSIAGLTTGYGYPLQDRLGRNLLSMNTATDPEGYLKVWIDTSPKG